MRCIPNSRLLVAITLGLAFNAWSQGGSGRGVATQSATAQGTAIQQAGAAGRGGGRGGSGVVGFYNYDTSASSGMTIADAPPAETRQKITISGQAIAYTARAGYMPLRNATTGQPAAQMFFTYYARDGAGDASARPVLFFLGGAPGMAAVWQEFGGFGPKRMKWAGDGSAGPPPYGWVDNPNTLLAQADLVFVNPVGTAYSRPSQPARGPDFWTTAGDIASLGEFVRSFVSVYDRRNSPVFLAGEDFGTARAAGLANYLIERQVPVAAVALLSMTLSADSVAGDTQYITLLPSLAMAAWYHKKLAPELQALSAAQIAEQARQFAAREYLHALYKGDRMTTEERAKVVASLSRLTGLSKAFIVNNDLRITLERFNAELLRDQRRTLSNPDARTTGFVPASGGGGRGGGGGGAGPTAAIDYSRTNLAGGFLTAYETYLRREITFTGGSGVFYLSGGGIGTFTSTGSDDASLAGAFARNPRLQLFAGVDYFDLNAPFYATEFTLAHLSVSPEIRARNITVSHFEAGQLAYLDDKALAQLQKDLAGFIQQALSTAR
jgi:carboxypeptidase C (cathepsin A)